MFTRKNIGQVEVTLPNGARLNMSDLPPVNTKRWVVRHKMTVVNAVLHDLLPFDEACQRYDLSQEELQSWMEMGQTHGADALKATNLMKYRQP